MTGAPKDAGHCDAANVSQTARRSLFRFARNESGATVVEYTFLVAFIALGLLGAMRAYSDKMVQVYNSLATAATSP